MSITRLGSTIVINEFNSRTATAALTGGRFAVAGPGGSGGPAVVVYDADGTRLQTINLATINGVQGLNTALDVVGLPNGGFVVSGAFLANANTPFSGAFVVFDAAGNPVPFTGPGGTTAFARPAFGGEFFGGGFQVDHRIVLLPDGRLFVAWNSVKDVLGGPVGTLTDGRPVFEAGSFAGGTAVDIRGRYVNLDGTFDGPEVILTQGLVDLPGYTIDSRFGGQALADLDVLPDGRILLGYTGDRYNMPTLFNGTLFSNRYAYASFRLFSDQNTGFPDAFLVGETPFNQVTIGADSDSSGFATKTAFLGNGRVAGFFGVPLSGPPSTYDIRMTVFDLGGTVVQAPVSLNIPVLRTFGRPVVFEVQAKADGGFLVLHNGDDGDVPADQSGSRWHIYVSEYNGAGGLENRIRLTTEAKNYQLRSFEPGPDGLFVASIFDLNAFSVQIFRIVDHGDTDLVGTGNDNANTAFLGAGNDWYDGRGGNDSIAGYGGNDRLFGGAGNDLINAGPGNDTVDGGADNDTLLGGDGNDVLRPGLGTDRVDLGNGTDTVEGSAAELDGDTLVNFRAGDRIVVQGATLAYANLKPVRGAASTVLGLDLDGNGSSDVRMTLLGDFRAGSFQTRSAPDGTAVIFIDSRINGTTGNDSINGSFDNDLITGLAGNDRINARGGDDTVFGGFGDDTIAGGDGNDDLRGSDGNDVMAGEGGNDLMLGEAGNDTLNGGGGNDTLEGGPGADRLVGGDGFDFASYARETGPVNIDMETGTYRGTDGVADTVFQIEGVIGSNFDDVLASLAAGATIDGRGGNDRIGGRNGRDVLFGGDGNDTINGGGGNDVIDGGSGDDLIYGGLGNDGLFGRAGIDRLFGMDGNDRLDGGGGNDDLTGGIGADVFVFSTGYGIDTVLDFSVAQGDRIDVSGHTAAAATGDGVLAQGSDVGADWVLVLGTDQLILKGISEAQLSGALFIV